MAWIARLWRGAVAPGTASLGLVAALVILAAACGDAEAAEPQPQTQPLSIGDKPAFTDRTAQEDINAGLIPLDELIRRGKELFIAPFNTLDGAGRPQSTGAAEVGVNNFRQVRVFPD
ncbi:MAG: hypothetical protein FJ317_07470, partial [SAR202 cluster bacterium]|nr:hypothetical protein [SAR202 cluster bacterium]